MKHSPCNDKQSREAANARLGQRKESPDLIGSIIMHWAFVTTICLSWGVVNTLTLFIDHTCCKKKMFADIHVNTLKLPLQKQQCCVLSLTLFTVHKDKGSKIWYHLNMDRLPLAQLITISQTMAQNLPNPNTNTIK